MLFITLIKVVLEVTEGRFAFAISVIRVGIPVLGGVSEKN